MKPSDTLENFEMTEAEREVREGLLSEEASVDSASPYHDSLRDTVKRRARSNLLRWALTVVAGAFAVLGALFSLALITGGMNFRGWTPSDSQTKSLQTINLPELPPTTWNGFENLEYLMVFGDSYSATGFKPQGPQPSEANPFGNPDTLLEPTTVTYWPWWLTMKHNQSSFMTYNYASGGATVDPKLAVALENNVENSLLSQVMNKYLPAYMGSPSQAVWQGKNTLHAFFFGINDIIIRSLKERNKQHSNEQFFDAYSHAVEQVYRSGARTFLFFLLPPVYMIDRYPQNRKPQEAQPWLDWNENVVRKVAALLQEKHPEARVFLFDTHSLYTAVMDNPSVTPATAHLTNLTHHCVDYVGSMDRTAWKPELCGPPVNEYMWLNGLHPTYVIMNATAARLVSDCFGAEKTGFCS